MYKCFYYVWQQKSNGLLLCNFIYRRHNFPRHFLFSVFIETANIFLLINTSSWCHYDMANVYSEISGKNFESSFCSSLFSYSNLLAVYCFISPGTFRNLELSIKKINFFFLMIQYPFYLSPLLSAIHTEITHKSKWSRDEKGSIYIF